MNNTTDDNYYTFSTINIHVKVDMTVIIVVASICIPPTLCLSSLFLGKCHGMTFVVNCPYTNNEWLVDWLIGWLIY